MRCPVRADGTVEDILALYLPSFRSSIDDIDPPGPAMRPGPCRARVGDQVLVDFFTEQRVLKARLRGIQFDAE